MINRRSVIRSAVRRIVLTRAWLLNPTISVTRPIMMVVNNLLVPRMSGPLTGFRKKLKPRAVVSIMKKLNMIPLKPIGDFLSACERSVGSSLGVAIGLCFLGPRVMPPGASPV